jgi:hypothetical protein
MWLNYTLPPSACQFQAARHAAAAIARPGATGYNAVLTLQQQKENLMKSKNIIRIALVTVFLLLIPLVAMQFTDEVDWNLFDFVVAGALLFGSGLTYELIARKGGNTAYRAAVGVAVATALLLVWINLAVGIIGSENNPVNALYFLVVFIGIIGVGIARFRPRGMAWTLFATAIAQLLVPVIALFIGKSQARALQDPPGFVGVLALNAFFAMLFVVSGLLFRHSAQDRSTGTAAVN